MAGETRFRVGDVVVLNGHRLTVTDTDDVDGVVFMHEAPDGLVSAVPADWLPDPEPREDPEPEWQPGDVVRAADGFVYLRLSSRTPWRAFSGEILTDGEVPRPLTRLVPDPLSNPAVRSVGERAARQEREAITGRVLAVLDAVDSGEFATANRDFGRGAAKVSRRVREALAAVQDRSAP